MGFVSDLFSSSKGAGYQADKAPIVDPFQQAQAQQLYGQQQANLGQQQNFVNALGAQGGIGNQSNVFAQQQALANQLNQMGQGGGPNPAMAQLANTTGQNVQQQAALQASQRGAGANAGLIARQAGQQGGAIQQQAAGQAAALRAQQQLAAIQALQQQQQMLGGLSTQQVGQQQQALSGLGAQTNAAQGNVLGAIANQNAANVGMQSNINNANSGIAQGNQKTQGGLLNGILGGVSSALMLNQGGSVSAGPRSGAGQMLSSYKDGGKVKGKAKVAGDSPKNDTVHARLSPGEIVVPRSAAKNPDKAAAFAKAVSMRGGK